MPEELRLRHRRLGIAWEMARTKHRNRVWLQGAILDSFRQLSDHVLGKHVFGLALPHEQRPKWEMVLNYEQEIRKRAYQWVRRGEVPTIEEGIVRGIKDPEAMNLHFIVPVTTSLAASASGGSTSKPAAATSTGSKGGGKTKTKGGNRPAKKLHVKTPDGRALCFKFNNSRKCTAKNCAFVHQCQKCLGNHPKSECPKKGDTARADPPGGGTD